MKIIILFKNGTKMILDCEKTTILEIENISKNNIIIEMIFTK